MNIPIHIPFITHAKKTNFYPHIPKKIGNMEVSMGKTQARLGTRTYNLLSRLGRPQTVQI